MTMDHVAIVVQSDYVPLPPSAYLYGKTSLHVRVVPFTYGAELL